MKTILYIHGMGGGSDSRIPSIIRDVLCHPEPSHCHPEPSHCHPERSEGSFKVVCRTYSFDPEEAAAQIKSWVEELEPDLVIGESLGCLHALRVSGVPKILISPALNAPLYFEVLAWLALIPGVTWIFDRIYKPRPGDRQPLHFTFRTLRKYRHHRKRAMLASRQCSPDKTSRQCSPDKISRQCSPDMASRQCGSDQPSNPNDGAHVCANDMIHAFIGTHDHYLRTAIVSRRTYKKHFGATYTLYDGSHFTEEEYIRSLVIPKIKELLG